MGSTFISLPLKRAMPDPAPVATSAAASKRSRAAPPPLPVPSGHAAFRLLCHVSRVGGIIGKGGSVIKQLQQSTGAKIRIEDAPPESPDRVITVVAPSAVAGRMALTPGSGSDGGTNGAVEEIDVSKAQEALVRVFERILEVAAESSGVPVGVVSCRLLAEVNQVGSVIGKGGSTVEKIKRESGTKIRVLMDKLPACASPTEEIVEVEGDVLAVKKALVAVSRCLQDCPPATKTRPLESKTIEAVSQPALRRPVEAISQETFWRPNGTILQETLQRPVEAISQGNLNRRIEVVPQETLSDMLFHRSLQHDSLVSSLPNSIGYASGVHSLTLESERIPSLDTKTMQQEVNFKILCSNDKVGGIIGKGGAIIKDLQIKTGASITIGITVADCDERLVTITASENPESQYSPAQKAVILVFAKSLESSIEKGLDLVTGNVTARLVAPSNQVGCLLGKGGSIISEMRKVTGTSIRVIVGNEVPKCCTENDSVVQISGEYSNVKNAIYNATGRLRDNLFSGMLKVAGTRSGSSLLTDSSAYGRLMEPLPLGLQASASVSHSLNRHPVTHNMDHIGFSHSVDRPRSPGLWPSETATVINPRGIADIGRGLSSFKGGLELGSGSKSAIVTNTTVEIKVPENVIDSVYGEGGKNLARLREISGAKVIVHEPRLGTSDRIIVISGTPDQTQAAQSLLQAFILTGT